MDRVSGAAAAAQLGTSIPRVVRAVERLGMTDARGKNRRLRLTAAQVDRLRDELGVTPRIPGLSQTEVKALAALRKAPLGLTSARAVAARAGLSPTAASRALRSLEVKGLVYRERRMLAAGRAQEAEISHANVLHEDWGKLAGGLAGARPPRRRSQHRRSRRVPPRLRHLFWNAEPSQLDVERSGPFIARRLLRALDPEGLAWGAAHLRASDWRAAAKARGLDSRVRALAENLASERAAW